LFDTVFTLPPRLFFAIFDEPVFICAFDSVVAT
jgi:hypothetical protein